MGRSRLVAKPIAKARTRHRLATSEISVPFVWVGRILLPFYLRFVLFYRKIEIRDPEKILEAIRDFQQKHTRLIVAFRHPYGDEPQLLYHVFENLIPRASKLCKMPLLYRLHLRIVHDYAVPLWGGAFIRFLLPRAGAVPVYHAKFDPNSLKTIRSILNDDPCPLGLAPEGQISYHSQTLPRIEQGTIRIGFWCARDIEKAGRQEKVQVLPLSIHYQYNVRDKKKILAAVDRLESLCGLPPARITTSTLEDLQSRIEEIEKRILEIVEAFYTRAYGYQPRKAVLPVADAAAARQLRWRALQDAALDIAEHLLGIDPKDEDITQRMYRIRLEGWDRIYPERPVDGLSPLESALSDRQSGEAWFAMRHMEFVDLMSYHDPDYLQGCLSDGPSFDRTVETVINLQDLAARLMGGNITNRPNVIRKNAVIVPGPCLDLTARLPDYHINAKEAVLEATNELAKRFRDCIKEYLDGTEC